jgi:hypothetical protein
MKLSYMESKWRAAVRSENRSCSKHLGKVTIVLVPTVRRNCNLGCVRMHSRRHAVKNLNFLPQLFYTNLKKGRTLVQSLMHKIRLPPRNMTDQTFNIWYHHRTCSLFIANIYAHVVAKTN